MFVISINYFEKKKLCIFTSIGIPVRFYKIYIDTGLAYDTPSQTIRGSVKWKLFKLFYHFKLLSLVYNSYYELSPLSLRKLFDKRGRTYNFRKTNCLRLPKPRLDLMKKSISYQGALL